MYRLLLALPADPGQAPPADGGGGGGLGALMPFFLILIVMMLFLPLLNKKDKKRQKRITELKKHDRVVTSGGIYGSVVAMDEHTVTLEVAKDVRMKLKRSSVFDLEKPGDAPKDEPAKKKKAGAKS